MEAWLEGPDGHIPLSTQRYAPDVVHPEGCRGITAFSITPWPTWQFAAGVTQEILADCDSAGTVLRWRRTRNDAPARLVVRLLLSGRDYHSLHHRNALFDFTAAVTGGNVTWQPYSDLPPILALTDGDYQHAPEWYSNFLYSEEAARGLDCIETLASPGLFRFDLAQGDAVMILRAGGSREESAAASASHIIEAENARRSARPAAWVAADSYLANRGAGRTLIAGFPWFTDWGRDTFIALRGLMLGTGRLAQARDILLAWSDTVSEGMLPNRFPDAGQAPEYNAVDASLWFVVAVHELLDATVAAEAPIGQDARTRLTAACEAVLRGYAAGTRFNIGADTDGMLRAGADGVQLTWMDAKIGDWVVTPRIGKPVEVQALWINALRIGAAWSPQWADLGGRAQAAFETKFLDPATGALVDVVDDGHRAGAIDRRIRPNQIFSVGGLPFAVLQSERARRVVDIVEMMLLTPLGLRTLSPDHPEYAGRYGGGPRERDAAYHQGTAWPWLMGPFVEAWLRVRGGTAAAKQEARRRFLAPLLEHLGTAGLGHVSEVADGDPPHRPGGCPFQAWSLGELIRIQRLLAPVQAGHAAVRGETKDGR